MIWFQTADMHYFQLRLLTSLDTYYNVIKMVYHRVWSFPSFCYFRKLSLLSLWIMKPNTTSFVEPSCQYFSIVAAFRCCAALSKILPANKCTRSNFSSKFRAYSVELSSAAFFTGRPIQRSIGILISQPNIICDGVTFVVS